MVGTTDCVKSTGRPGKKVSKPLMEKKRRARINKCLDQLKSLLENYYTSNIRKRKLEKADILELTVKHLRNLQKIKCCTTNASEVSDFQAGFSSCLATVGQYLSMADNFSGSDRWMLSHLPRKLTEGSSTVDSDTGKPAAQEAAKQRLLPPTYGPETRRTPTHVPFAGCLTRAPHPARSEVRPTEVKGGRQCLGTKSAHAALNSPEQKACGVFRQRNQVSSFEHNVWRPW